MPYAFEPRGARYWIVRLGTDGRRSETGESYATPEETMHRIVTLEDQDKAVRKADQKPSRNGAIGKQGKQPERHSRRRHRRGGAGAPPPSDRTLQSDLRRHRANPAARWS